MIKSIAKLITLNIDKKRGLSLSFYHIMFDSIYTDETKPQL